MVSGILEGMGIGFCWISGGLRRNAGLVSLWEEGVKLQEFSGEIGESIRRGLEGASGSGLLRKQEVEDLSFLGGFQGGIGLSRAGGSLWNRGALSG